MKEFEVKCPNCGATSGADFVAQNVWRCRFCSTEFVVEDEQAEKRAAEQAAFLSESAKRRQARRNKQAAFPWRIIALCVTFMLACLVAALVLTGLDKQNEKDRKARRASHASRHTSDGQPGTTSASRLTATFHFDRTVTSGNYQYVLGEVTNTSKLPIGAAKVYILMQNAAGKEIASKTGYTENDYIKPGQSVPFYAMLSKPPHYAKLAFDVSAARPIMKPAEGLHLQNIPPRVGSYGQWVFSGKVTNGGKETAEFIKVEVVARDAQGKLLGVNESYADQEKLAPGASTRYEVTSVSYPKHAHPAKFDYLVWGERE